MAEQAGVKPLTDEELMREYIASISFIDDEDEPPWESMPELGEDPDENDDEEPATADAKQVWFSATVQYLRPDYSRHWMMEQKKLGVSSEAEFIAEVRRIYGLIGATKFKFGPITKTVDAGIDSPELQAYRKAVAVYERLKNESVYRKDTAHKSKLDAAYPELKKSREAYFRSGGGSTGDRMSRRVRCPNCDEWFIGSAAGRASHHASCKGRGRDSDPSLRASVVRSPEATKASILALEQKRDAMLKGGVAARSPTIVKMEREIQELKGRVADARWTGTLTAKTKTNKTVTLTATVTAPDHYAAGDLLRAAAEKKFGDIYYPVIKFGSPSRLPEGSESHRAARGAGPEEE